MKRVFCILIALILFLTSCQNVSVDGGCDIISNFTAQANVITKDGNILCSISRASDGVFCVSIYEPEQLKGLKYIRMDNKYSIEYNDLKYETSDLYFPQTAFFKSIICVLDSIDSGCELKKIDSYDNISVLKGNCDVGEFEVMVNKNTKYIEKITINSMKLSVIFSEQH